jgi:hypothetical protein
MRSFTTVIVAALILASTLVSAQPQFQAGGNFSLAFPQKDFKKNVDNLGIGAVGHFAYRFGQSPFLAGASFGFYIYGNSTREVPFNAEIPDVLIDVTTTNSFVMGHLLLRVQPQTGSVRPYIDGLFGFNFLNTTTKISSQGYDSEGDNEIASTNNFNDIASNFGFGGGLMFCVYDAVARGREGNLQSVSVDLGIRSLKGGEAQYLKGGWIQYDENGKIKYVKSETDLVTYHIGVSFDFTISAHSTAE